jgi:septal ring factor EnvC (AmiA/AmiB activator)
VRHNIYPWTKVFALCFLAASLGCSAAPPCPVTPVNIEETREDVQVLERDLAATRERADELQTKLNAKKAELESKKDKPAELRKKLDELKKGSGRFDEKKGTDDGKE